MDENDHQPVFSRKLYIGGVTEDTKIFTSVLKIVVRKLLLLFMLFFVSVMYGWKWRLELKCQLLLPLAQHLLCNPGGKIHLILSPKHSFITSDIARYIYSSISLSTLSDLSTSRWDQSDLSGVIRVRSQKHGWTYCPIIRLLCPGASFCLLHCTVWTDGWVFTWQSHYL